MAIGTGTAILGAAGISAVTGLIGGNAAADAQADASRAAADLQLDMFETQREDFAPWMAAGGNALAALEYELGLGPRPRRTARRSDFEIERIGGGAPGAQPNALGRMAMGPINDRASGGGYATGGAAAEPASDRFRVGDRTFDTRAGAREFIDGRVERPGNFDYGGFRATPGYRFRVNQGQTAIDRSAAARGGLFSGATIKASQRFGQGLAAEEYGNYLARLGSLAGIGVDATRTTAGLGGGTATNVGNALMAEGDARASGYANTANSINAGLSNALGGLAYGGYLGRS